MSILEFIKTARRQKRHYELYEKLYSGDYDMNERDEKGYNLLDHLVLNLEEYCCAWKSKCIGPSGYVFKIIKILIVNGFDVDGELISPIYAFLRIEMIERQQGYMNFVHEFIDVFIGCGCDVNMFGAFEMFEGGGSLLEFALHTRVKNKKYGVTVYTIEKLINAGAKLNGPVALCLHGPMLRKLLERTQDEKFLI